MALLVAAVGRRCIAAAGFERNAQGVAATGGSSWPTGWAPPARSGNALRRAPFSEKSFRSRRSWDRRLVDRRRHGSELGVSRHRGFDRLYGEAGLLVRNHRSAGIRPAGANCFQTFSDCRPGDRMAGAGRFRNGRFRMIVGGKQTFVESDLPATFDTRRIPQSPMAAPILANGGCGMLTLPSAWNGRCYAENRA
jgi:hypothetical protein